jgi:acyl-CoA reductase-like NAD-dependent aldehyde dehydrogenase
VDKVTFTGSTAAGRRIMSICGERIARITLELGGKSAGIIADDIDVDGLLPDLVTAGIGHTGQICAALTRVLVPAHRQAEIVDKMAAIMSEITVGDPMDPATQLGPLAMERPSPAAGSTSPPCSRTCATRCGSPRRRSSARSSA